MSGESHSYNQVNANFELRAIDRYMMGVSGNNPRVVTIYEETPISKGELTVKYCPLSGEQSGYSGMALKYRSFLMARHGLQYKPTGQPLCLEALGAVRLKESFLGFLVNRTVPLTRFDELSEMLQELNERGVDSVAVKYTDWNKDKINGRVVDDAAVVGKIGGKSGLNKLLNGLRNQGATLFWTLIIIKFGGGTAFIQKPEQLPKRSPTGRFISTGTVFWITSKTRICRLPF